MGIEKCHPNFEEFKELAKQGNVIPVYRQLLADTLTPVSAFQKVEEGDYAFLLESVTGGERIGRYSFVGSRPFMVFRCSGTDVEITSEAGVERSQADDPLEALAELVGRFQTVDIEGLPDFSGGTAGLAGGAVGYASYDVVRYFEHLPDVPPDTLSLPDLYFMFCDTMLIFDNVANTLKVVSNARLDGCSEKAAYDRAVESIQHTIDRLRTPVTTLSDDIVLTDEVERGFSSNFSREAYCDAVRKCKEYVAAGDIFQVVLSQRLRTETKARPFHIYRALRAINPSPYMFYLKLGDLKLIGSSPEVMVKVENSTVTLRPIAGTRRRGKTDAEDRALAEELLADPKERAEHVMLLDLGRNDVGRVANYGTVRITEEMVIEKYSHVMHIVSEVAGELQEDKTAFDTLKACLPAGTLSGAPKVRAMEIIDELEPEKRGPYGGAVGYIDFRGNLNTCITIRTIVQKGQDAYVQAGAGIVADSVPEREYEETLNKARGLLKAIEVAEGQMTQAAGS